MCHRLLHILVHRSSVASRILSSTHHGVRNFTLNYVVQTTLAGSCRASALASAVVSTLSFLFAKRMRVWIRFPQRCCDRRQATCFSSSGSHQQVNTNARRVLATALQTAETRRCPHSLTYPFEVLASFAPAKAAPLRRLPSGWRPRNSDLLRGIQRILVPHLHAERSLSFLPAASTRPCATRTARGKRHCDARLWNVESPPWSRRYTMYMLKYSARQSTDPNRKRGAIVKRMVVMVMAVLLKILFYYLQLHTK